MMRKHITPIVWGIWIIANICPIFQQNIFVAIIYATSLVLMGACVNLFPSMMPMTAQKKEIKEQHLILNLKVCYMIFTPKNYLRK